jgi:pantetheine-phosphate adenylyltransferase
MNAAVYAGSFDPITSGHVAVVEKASKVFDKVIVLIADNPDKEPMFTVDERLKMIRMAVSGFSNVDGAQTDGLVAVYAREHGAGFLVRGIRNTSDAEYEMTLTELNKMIAPEIHTVFIPSEAGMTNVSSSKLKELARTGQNINDYCPPSVGEMLQQKLSVTG